MLYNEFTNLTGLDATISELDYHAMIEPQYYRHPGDKHEFLRDWLVNEMQSCAKTLQALEENKRNDSEVYQECKKDLRAFAAGLVKLLSA